MPWPCSAWALPAWKSVRAVPRMAAETGLPSRLTSGSSEVEPALPVHEEGQRAVLHGVVAVALIVAKGEGALPPRVRGCGRRAPCR